MGVLRQAQTHMLPEIMFQQCADAGQFHWLSISCLRSRAVFQSYIRYPCCGVVSYKLQKGPTRGLVRRFIIRGWNLFETAYLVPFMLSMCASVIICGLNIPPWFCNDKVLCGRHISSPNPSFLFPVGVWYFFMQPIRTISHLGPRYLHFNFPIDVSYVEVGYNYR